jgi:DNA-binding transcriptional regulator PaaX
MCSALNYNELKLLILRLLSQGGPKDSATLATELNAFNGRHFDIHAIRMALMRYYKLGLLARERRSGVYFYEPSDRGSKRLEWLESIKSDKKSQE